MEKTKYVIADAELRNSASENVSVAFSQIKEARVGLANSRHDCFENNKSHPYFIYLKFTSSSSLAELVFVHKKEGGMKQ